MQETDMKKINAISLPVLAVLLLAGFQGCEYKIPQSIYPGSGGPDPVITSVVPDSAFGGVTVITIQGRNFAPTADRNFVFFGRGEAVILSCSETELRVVRPLSIGDTATIRVAVRDAFGTANVGPYKLEKGITDVDELGWVFSIAVDASENLYAATERAVVKISPSGKKETVSSLPFRVAGAIRTLPDGSVYVQRDDNKLLYRVPPGGGDPQELLFQWRKASVFDLDGNGNLYSGGLANGLMFTNPAAKTSVSVGDYANSAIKAVRVVNGYVYVALNDPLKGGVWRNQILSAAGAIGPSERVLDWSTTGAYAASALNDIAFAADGDLFIATDHDPDPVLVVHPDGTRESLYPGYLAAPATSLMWGNGNYLYINKSDQFHQGVVRVIIGKNGAVTYGRQ
jgi:hypothetical protein